MLLSIIKKIYAFLIDALQSLLIAASIFLVIYVAIARPFQVNGQSMFPNFHDQEYVLTNLITLRFHTPMLGDVIVFQAPIDAEKDFIKRVIGTPGDTVTVRDGSVFLNGNRLDESAYLKDTVQTYGGAFLKDGETITVPQDEYFVMGDNRTYSSDSREWGFVKKSELIGESFFVYWPPPSMRFIHNPYGAKK